MSEAKRKPDNELGELSAKVAVDVLNPQLAKFDTVQRSLAVNSWAHGYFMGYREREKRGGRKFASFFGWLDRTDLDDLSNKAAKFYMKEKFPSLPLEDSALVKACLAEGFQKGFQSV